MKMWVEQLVELMGDKMPVDNTIHMPMYVKPATMYNEWCQEMVERYSVAIQV